MFLWQQQVHHTQLRQTGNQSHPVDRQKTADCKRKVRSHFENMQASRGWVLQQMRQTGCRFIGQLIQLESVQMRDGRHALQRRHADAVQMDGREAQQ